jgi:hypothetical protein
MNLKKIGKVFTSKFVGTGPSSYEKIIYRAAVLQRLSNSGVNDECNMFTNTCVLSIHVSHAIPLSTWNATYKPGVFGVSIRESVLPPTLFNLALEYTIRRVQINQDGFILSNTRQLLVYAYDVNILGGSVHTMMGG